MNNDGCLFVSINMYIQNLNKYRQYEVQNEE